MSLTPRLRPGQPPPLHTVHAVVPAEHRWVSVLFVALARLGAPVREARLADGALTLRFEPAGDVAPWWPA